jgi:hypothetical protein
MGLHGLLRESFTFLYVGDVRTWQETYLWASTGCYGNNFTFLYVDSVRMSHETYLTSLHGLLRGELYFLISRWCSHLTGNILMGLHGLLRIALFHMYIYIYMMFVPHRKHILVLHGLLRGQIAFIRQEVIVRAAFKTQILLHAATQPAV